MALQISEDTCSKHGAFLCHECFDSGATGTCQTCGAYWDMRQKPVCPCGGEVL